jgi:putative peptidoglycan lipid II flippase
VSSSKSSSLVRSNITVALGTALSRLTGLIQVIVFGIVIGQNALADAFDGANNSPNSIYELLLGGVLSATLVPVFTRHLEDNDDEATDAVVTVSMIVLVGLTFIAVVLAPLIFRLISWNVDKSVDVGEYRAVGTALSRIFLLQIFFYGVMALGSALLNARRRFFAPAWAPVLANLVFIAALLAIPTAINHVDPSLDLAHDSRTLRFFLGFGETGGIALMAITVLFALHRAGVRLRFKPNWHHPAVRQVFRMSLWTVGYAASNIVAVYVVKNLAKPGSGGQDAYAKAFTFFQLPHGLLAMSITTTFVPDMARLVARKDRPGFVSRTSLGVRLVALFTFPASFGFLVLRRPLFGLLQHGEFDATAAFRSSQALAGFAIGLVGFSIYLFALRGFYAHNDTKTPFKINLVENIINVVLAIALVPRWGVLGLGLAFAIAYLVSAAWALLILSYKVGQFDLRPIFSSFGRMALASVVMAEIVWLLANAVGGNDSGGAFVRVIAGTVVGAVVYFALLLVLGAPELGALRERLWRNDA